MKTKSTETHTTEAIPPEPEYFDVYAGAITSEIELHKLHVSPMNPRRVSDPKKDAELAAQIASVGLLHPGIARRNWNIVENYELLTGSRRYQAHKTLGMATMRCIVRDLTDAQALEIITIENLGREDLTPFEEADGVQHLLGAGWEAKAIGDRLGKSEAWVRRRAKLLNLSKAWQKAVLDAKSPVSVWPAVLLERVAALPPAVQDAALGKLIDQIKDNNAPWQQNWREARPLPTETELARWLANEYLHTLAGAPFDITDESLYPRAGACTTCPKRSSVEPLLWSDVEDSKKKTAADRCLDKVCYDTKRAAHVKRLLEENPDARPATVAAKWEDHQAAEKQHKNALAFPHHAKPAAAKPNEKGAVPIVVVAGEGAGTLRWIKPGKTESPASRGNGGGVKKKGVPAEKQRVRRRASIIVKAVRERVTKMAEDTRIKLPDHLLDPVTAMHLAAVFGTDERQRDAPWQTWRAPKDPWKAYGAAPKKDEADRLVRCVLPVLAQRCYFISGETAEQALPEARKVAALLDIDIVAISEQALVEIPEPAAAKARAGKSGAKSKAVRGKRKSAAQIVEEAAAFEENTGDENDDDPSGQYEKPGYRDPQNPVVMKTRRKGRKA